MTREEAKLAVRELFKDREGNPFEMTDGQSDIFIAIFDKENPRVHCMCFTRYGKSEVISMAVLLAAATFPEKWSIIAGTQTKAKIIMEYIIQHIYDNEYFIKKFQRDRGESDEEIRRHRNKSRINFKLKDGLLGEIYVCSAKEALGFGSPNVIEDEASLIPDDEHAMVLRMLTEQPNTFLCKIGNPMLRNHFLKSYKDDHYHKIDIDCYKGEEEGRITKDQIEEQQRDNKLFRQLYLNKFPDEDEVDDKGYINLFTTKELEEKNKIIKLEERLGIPRLGVDIGHGGDTNCWVLRWKNYACILKEDKDNNLINVALKTKFIADKFNIPASNVYIDGTGMGIGVVDYLQQRCKLPINNVINGSKSNDPDMLNKRAECYWRLSKWNGSLEETFNEELLQIKYRIQRDKKLMIMSKDDMRKQGISSPNKVDALALTFSNSDLLYDIVKTDKTEGQKELEAYRQQQKYGNTNTSGNQSNKYGHR